MTYNEEIQRIQRNASKKAYASIIDRKNVTKGIQTLYDDLLTLKDDHIELVRKNWENIDDPGSIIELWKYCLADMRRLLRL